ncbi:hypothetical protein Enr13x_42230 [Stieleria neptunia]|uniref:Uncharacterized protein n=1 Tax=Stieleria neptunia TaxID=2527979 RepID=A0A518HU21_9BACT|nr:hypothetical protein Enr13x_42230 [Stieleria neptunia]
MTCDHENDDVENWDWDHPVVRAGILPEHLARLMVEGSRPTTYWNDWCAANKSLWKRLKKNGRRWFSLPAIELWIREPRHDADEYPPGM